MVARLPSSANPVVSYQLFVGYYNWSGTERSASRWTLDASYDGVNWFTVDDHSANDATRPASNNSPYNGGVAYAVGASEIQEVAVDSGDVQVLPGGFYGTDVRVLKTGNGTVAAVGRGGVAAIRVSEGTLAVKGVSFMRYRFKIDRVRGTNQHMEISEFKLMNGGGGELPEAFHRA